MAAPLPPLVVLITGANRGLGFSAAARLLSLTAAPEEEEQQQEQEHEDQKEEDKTKRTQNKRSTSRGVKLILACRDVANGEAAAERLAVQFPAAPRATVIPFSLSKDTREAAGVKAVAILKEMSATATTTTIDTTSSSSQSTTNDDKNHVDDGDDVDVDEAAVTPFIDVVIHNAGLRLWYATPQDTRSSSSSNGNTDDDDTTASSTSPSASSSVLLSEFASSVEATIQQNYEGTLYSHQLYVPFLKKGQQQTTKSHRDNDDDTEHATTAATTNTAIAKRGGGRGGRVIFLGSELGLLSAVRKETLLYRKLRALLSVATTNATTTNSTTTTHSTSTTHQIHPSNKVAALNGLMREYVSFARTNNNNTHTAAAAQSSNDSDVNANEGNHHNISSSSSSNPPPCCGDDWTVPSGSMFDSGIPIYSVPASSCFSRRKDDEQVEGKEEEEEAEGKTNGGTGTLGVMDPYVVSKLGVAVLSRILAEADTANTNAGAGGMQAGDDGIEYCCCCPGWCRTDMTASQGNLPPRSAAEGAEVVAWLATTGLIATNQDNDHDHDDINGHFFSDKDRRVNWLTATFPLPRREEEEKKAMS